MTLEGLKQWLPGRTIGLGPLSAAVAAERLFESIEDREYLKEEQPGRPRGPRRGSRVGVEGMHRRPNATAILNAVLRIP
jgi:hypothetical protein